MCVQFLNCQNYIKRQGDLDVVLACREAKIGMITFFTISGKTCLLSIDSRANLIHSFCNLKFKFHKNSDTNSVENRFIIPYSTDFNA